MLRLDELNTCARPTPHFSTGVYRHLVLRRVVVSCHHELRMCNIIKRLSSAPSKDTFAGGVHAHMVFF